MAKKPLNLLIEADLIQKARDHGLVLSRFLENKLQEYFSFIDAVSKSQTIQKEKSGLVEIRTQDLLRVRETS
jgi:post-segregation antitoxin (ccd killing protein)